MALSNKLKEKISIEVIKTLITRFENFPENASNNRNAPFHEAFLNAFSDKLNEKVPDIPFFISLSSWLHGLSTTLGQTFFENVTHHLCDGEKREYTSKKLGNLQISETQKANISNIITDLSNTTSTPDLVNENSLIFNNYDTPLVSAIDFSADVFIEDTDTITAIELKSVKPNSGEMRGEKQKILEGKAALFRLFPDKHIKFFIGFPFDPTVNPGIESVTSFNKPRFLDSIINLTKYFAANEVLIANELWDMLSGQENTMEDILDIINSISTPEFLVKFQLLTDNTKRLTPEYEAQLIEWNLFSEIELIDNNDTIIQKIGTDKALTKKYNKIAFDGAGNYCTDRYAILKNLIIN
jgi:MjaII restriction endonuclease.